MIITMVPVEGLPMVWSKVAFMLDKALATSGKRRASIVELYELCLSGRSNLWIVADDDKEIIAACTTSVIDYPSYKALSVQYLGGTRMKEWLSDSMELMKRFAIDIGCETMEGYGRDAWLRVFNQLTEFKWRRVYTTFEVDLTEEVPEAMAAE